MSIAAHYRGLFCCAFLLTLAGGGELRSAPTIGPPVLGGQLYGRGGEVDLFLSTASDASYTNKLFYITGSTLPGSPVDTGYTNQGADKGVAVDNLVSLAINQEIIFGIEVEETGYKYYMGPADRNPDNRFHATIEQVTDGGDTFFRVRFEDLYDLGDNDFNDFVFDVFGVGDSLLPIPKTPLPKLTHTPEPTSVAVWGFAGLMGAAALWWRRKRVSQSDAR